MISVQNNDQAFSTLDRQRFSELLLKQFGLNFSETRWTELDHAIRYAFAASTCSSLEEYYNLLSNTQIGTVEMDRLVNAVTVNETHFFRDDAQFNALYQFILPRIIEHKRPVRTLRIWSAGCSSGEEPYSLAILLRELLPDIDQWSITILGTDINTASLERAHQGVYGNWAFREERAKNLRSRYFRVDNGRFILVPDVRRMVLFKRLNLAEPCYPSYETNTMMMDLILCRNVTIYFNEQITRWIIDRFYDALVDGGWLVVGHSEPSIDTYHRFRVRNFTDTLAYQKSPETAGLKWPSAKPVAPAPIPLPPLPRLDMAKVTAGFHTPQPEVIRPVLELENGSKEVDPLAKVMELLDYGRSEEARIGLLSILKDRPRDANVHALLGKVFANLGGCYL
jgi:chemotaxis protein methyltransferase CheR